MEGLGEAGGSSEADALAAENYLATQASREATWTEALRLDPVAVKRESSLVAFADTLSLALCGGVIAPMSLEAPAQDGDLIRMELTYRAGAGRSNSSSPRGLG